MDKTSDIRSSPYNRDFYDRVEKSYGNHNSLPYRKAKIIAEKVSSGHRILDIGCGSGEFLFRMKDKFDYLFGVDSSPSAIEWAKQKNREFKNIQFFEGDIDKCKFKDDFFDCCLCLDVLEHAKNPMEILVEIKRVLRKEGQLVVSMPNWFDIIFTKALRLHRMHLHAHAPCGWKNMIRKAGFKVCSYRAIDSLVMGNDWLARKLPILGKGIIIFAKN